MMRKQDKGGPFFWSRLESLTNPWPISIRVGQSGPWLSTPVPALQRASCPTLGGPVPCSGSAARVTRSFRSGFLPDRSTAQRGAACAADPRQVDRHLAPSEAQSAGRSAAANDAQATPSRERDERLPGRSWARATGSLSASNPPRVGAAGRRACWRRIPPPQLEYSVGFPRMRSDFRESLRPLSCFRGLSLPRTRSHLSEHPSRRQMRLAIARPTPLRACAASGAPLHAEWRACFSETCTRRVQLGSRLVSGEHPSAYPWVCGRLVAETPPSLAKSADFRPAAAPRDRNVPDSAGTSLAH